MITTTWTDAPAALLGLGGAAVRPCTGFGSGMPIDVVMGAPLASVQGTGLPVGGSAVRIREAFPPAGTQTRTARTHNYIGAKNDGTTLGIRSPGRPLS